MAIFFFKVLSSLEDGSKDLATDRKSNTCELSGRFSDNSRKMYTIFHSIHVKIVERFVSVIYSHVPCTYILVNIIPTQPITSVLH